MILFLFMSAVLWLVGIAMKAPKKDRWIMIGGLFGLIMLSHLVLPESHAVRQAFGGSFAHWVLMGMFAVLAVIYARWVQGLKARRQPNVVTSVEETVAAPAPLFAAGELDRYARHIVLHDIGGPGQKALKEARVLVVGAGGLGSPALMYLAASGVGTIEIVDDDVVELSNLQRQVIHSEDAQGQAKVTSAAARIGQVNSHCDVITHEMRLDDRSADALISGVDIVLDGCDNFKTRYLVNEICTNLGKPLISGALSQWEGQVSVFDPAHGTPCYKCVFPEAPMGDNAPTCATTGVLSPLPGVVGAMMAAETVKVITGAGQALRGEMLIYDAKYAETRKIRLQKGFDCPVCGPKS
ncbi:HesA/MoeB/ThiF family protein [Halocynthiibacter namhaensis]|uniref:HesA/MoeB/ThiF family protein n=1 Tax=Halocynthiibacter namhaensis TaxID=1290553 RepID=UPI000579535A|nr:HesA/MoeB/ThiF family protein [Halocynthiibacter namhaensis]